jgi:hypothetical protein
MIYTVFYNINTIDQILSKLKANLRYKNFYLSYKFLFFSRYGLLSRNALIDPANNYEPKIVIILVLVTYE